MENNGLLHSAWSVCIQDGPNSRQDPIQLTLSWPKLAPNRLHIPFDRLHVALGSPKLTVRWLHKSSSRHQVRLICAQIGPKMDEVGPKMAQSRTDMAPVELKLATSWPQDCMKADISHEYIKPTNSFWRTMIYYIPHAQFASKMAQIRAKIRAS